VPRHEHYSRQVEHFAGLPAAARFGKQACNHAVCRLRALPRQARAS
jgi:hypothetical protein